MNQLGRYRLRRRIETSKTSVVYLVRDSPANREVVVKTQPLSASDGSANGILAEEKNKDAPHRSGKIDHRNAVPIQEAFEEIGLLWMVMEHVQGKTLRVLADQRLLGKDSIGSVLRQLADCLDYAHQKWTFHGSLKPSKVMLEDDGTVRILGFGLPSVAVGGQNGASGSQYYIAPEQVDGHADARSDQYALSAIAYWLLTGADPQSENPAAPNRLNPSLGPDVSTILLKGLARQPEERFGSCTTFVKTIEKALENVPSWQTPQPQFPSRALTIAGADAEIRRQADRTDVGTADSLLGSDPGSTRSRGGVWLWLVLGILVGLAVGYNFLPNRDRVAASPQPPSLTPPGVELPEAAIGTDYTYTFSFPGGKAENWTLRDGLLPSNLVLSPDGTLRGTPTDMGVFPFTVEAELPSGEVARQPASLRVASNLQIATPPVLPAAVAGLSYSHLLETAGAAWPWHWTLAEGSLPDDLELDESTGMIAGVASQTGNFSFTLALTDASNTTVRRAFTLTVDSGTNLSVAPTLPAAVAGQPYSHSLQSSGGKPPYRWSVRSGSWPPGLSLDPKTGAIRGQPTQAGNYRLVLAVSDARNVTATRQVSMRVASSLSFASAPELPAGQAGSAYAIQLAVAGGRAPYRWLVVDGMLPAGLILDSSTGALRGTPSNGGSFQFTTEVTDSSGEAANRAFRVRINTGIVFATEPELPAAEAGASYLQQLRAVQGTPPYRWEITEGEAPPGLQIERSGRIIGTPQRPGQYRFTARLTDAAGLSAIRAFTLAVQDRVGIPNDLQLLPATAGEAYSFDLRAAGGTPPYTWSVGAGDLPPGISLRPETGTLQGTPTQQGSYEFSLVVASGSRASASRAFQLRVGPRQSGQIVWQGRLESDRVLTIQDGQFPSTGTLAGALPGGPIELELQPQGLSVVQAPSAGNSWKLLVIHAGREPRTRIVINWKRVE
jgi:serine/threonine protein kinase